MINSFLGLDTLTNSLSIQQLNQDLIASNLSKTYQDSDGYLIASRERLEITPGPSLLFGSQSGPQAIGTGQVVQQITRLRDMYLDAQIQQQSSVVGAAEIGSNIVNQINNIINGPTGTLDAALSQFAADWTALSANPSSVALRSAVVNDGVAFASLARNQYSQLENLQYNLNGQISQTVTNVNQLLQQLSSINKQLLTSQGANVDNLLDARDYALDQLSRIVNIQSNFGTAGTVSVYLGGTNMTLVDPSGAAILQTNAENPHNPGMTDVSLQTSEGTIISSDVSKLITGGNLAGEIKARDVTLEAYKDQVDQIATSVLNTTNTLHEAGYAADGATTGTAFFTGTGAADINVNSSLTADSTRALVAASSVPFVLPATGNGQIAQFLGGLPNLLANNFMESQPSVAGGVIDPTQAISTQVFAIAPVAGSFTVNGVLVSYTTADTIDTILAKINAADPTVDAVFNAATKQFFILSTNPVNIANVSGNFVGGLSNWSNLNNVLTSSIRMNNGFAQTDPKIDYNDILKPTASPLGSAIQGTAFNTGPNSAAFRVTPGTSGSFTFNGFTVNWTNKMSLANIVAQIAAVSGNTITASFSSATQTLTLLDHTPQPLVITDTTGNFTVFTGLNANTPIGNLTNGILTQVSSDLSSTQLVQGQAQNTLDQLNNAQADLGAVALDSGDHGEPIQTEEQAAMQSLIAFNASLQVMQIIDQMYSDLVGILGATSQGSFPLSRSS